MGACCQSELSREAELLDEKLTRQLQQDHRKDQSLKRLLFFGCSGSGKNTLMKQLRILHGVGYSKNDKNSFINIIHEQCLQQIQILIHLINYDDKKEYICTESLEAMKYLNSIKLSETKVLNHSVVSSINCLWSDDIVKQIYATQLIFNMKLYNSTGYFLDSIDRISDNTYIPTEKDIVFVNNKHSNNGIDELQFDLKSNKYILINVYQDPITMNKWIHQFEYISGLIFVISLSCYNLSDYPTKTIVVAYINSLNIDIPYDLINVIAVFYHNDGQIGNKMDEQLELFERFCNYDFVENIPLLLFLNKKDAFAEKIQSIPLTVCPSFKDYNYDPSFKDKIQDDYDKYDAAICYIRDTFEYLLHKSYSEKYVYSHVTCALDQDNIEKVFNDVQHIVVPRGYRDPQMGH
eukprot:503027_1